MDPTLVAASAAAPIRVSAYPGERPVIQGILELRSADYWTFDGINVTWDAHTGHPHDHMVRIIDGVGWTFRNAELWGAHSFAALLIAGQSSGEPSNWTVTGNCIHDTYDTNDTNQDQLIYANTGVTAGTGLIERNLLFDAVNGMGVKLGGPSTNDGGAANVTVRFNTIYHTSQNVLVSWRSYNNSIYDNLMGLAGSNYANVRGYELTGAGNVMSANVGFAADKILLNDPGYRGVQDGGGNVFGLNPQFDNTSSCAGFHAQNPAVAAYGRGGS